MNTFRILPATAVAMIAVAAALSAGDTALKSGPQVGAKIPGAFEPLNVTGDYAGKQHCLVCEHGLSPVAMVFARETSPALTKLIKSLDEATAKNKASEMGSFVIFLSDKANLDKELKTLAEQEKIKNVTLAIDTPTGPKEYSVAKNADITVVLYNEHKVLANFAFAKGGLNDNAVADVVKGVSKLTAK